MTWQEDEKRRIDEENDGLDRRPRLEITEGDLVVEMNVDEKPRTVKTMYGPCKVINLESPMKDGKKSCIMPSDALFREIVQAVLKQKGIVKLNINRKGTTQKDTRYKVKVLG